MTLDLPLIDVFGRGGALKSCWYGDCLPSRDFPMLIDLYLQGRLDLDAFVSETIGLDDVEAAFEKMHHGEVLRSVGGRSDGAAIDQRRHQRARSRLDGGTWDVDNNVWLVGDDDEVRRHRRRRTTPRRSWRRSAAGAVHRDRCTHAHDDHIDAAARARATRPARRSCCTRTTGCCGTSSTRTATPTPSSPTATSSTVGRRRR